MIHYEGVIPTTQSQGNVSLQEPVITDVGLLAVSSLQTFEKKFSGVPESCFPDCQSGDDFSYLTANELLHLQIATSIIERLVRMMAT